MLKASSQNTEKILKTMKDGFKIFGRIIVAETSDEKRKLSDELGAI